MCVKSSGPGQHLCLLLLNFVIAAEKLIGINYTVRRDTIATKQIQHPYDENIQNLEKHIFHCTKTINLQ